MNHPGFHTLPNDKGKYSIPKPRFFMDITCKHNHKVNQITDVLFISIFTVSI